MHTDPKDKAYLQAKFKECTQKGHKLFDWGGMTYCAVCGGASYLIALRDKNKQTPTK